jgi:fluoride exporter
VPDKTVLAYRGGLAARLRNAYNRIHMDHILIISIGAALGANARYWIGGWAADRFGTAFPYGNLIINVFGSFMVGIIITMMTERFIVEPSWRIFIAIGFFGSFTTFSSYTFESLALILSGQWILGIFNLFGSSFLGGLAALLGILLGRAL